jgi:hypothetical protein
MRRTSFDSAFHWRAAPCHSQQNLGLMPSWTASTAQMRSRWAVFVFCTGIQENNVNNCNPGGKSDDWRNRPSGDRMSVSDLKRSRRRPAFNRPMQPRARTQAAATVRERVAKRSATNRLRGQVGRASSGAQAGEKKFRRRFPWPTVQDYS